MGGQCTSQEDADYVGQSDRMQLSAASEETGKTRITAAEEQAEQQAEMAAYNKQKAEEQAKYQAEMAAYNKQKAEAEVAQAKYLAEMAAYNKQMAEQERARQADRDQIVQREADRLAAEQAEVARIQKAKEEQLANATEQQKYRIDRITRNGKWSLDDPRLATPEFASPLYGVSNAESVLNSDPRGTRQKHCAQ